MGIDFGVIWATDFDDDIRFYVRRPARRPNVTRRPPSHKKSKDMKDRYVVMGINFGVIWASDFNNPAGQGSPAARRHTNIQK